MTFRNDPETVASYFTTTPEGAYRFARWGRPIVPVVFGVDDATVSVLKGAIEAVVGLSGHKMAETDPELGANLMFFFFCDWRELLDLEHLDQMVPDLVRLVGRLENRDATQYRLFRFDPDGAIKACFVFLRMTGEMAETPVEDLALGQAVRVILLWGDAAFRQSPLAVVDGVAVLRQEVADLIRVAYDPVLPAVAQDESHALRLAARIAVWHGPDTAP